MFPIAGQDVLFLFHYIQKCPDTISISQFYRFYTLHPGIKTLFPNLTFLSLNTECISYRLHTIGLYGQRSFTCFTGTLQQDLS